MLYRIRHETAYNYADPVQLSHNMAHLQPIHGGRQIVRSFELDVVPEPAVLSERIDCWGNVSHFLLVQDAHREFKVVATSEVEVLPSILPETVVTEAWELVAASMRPRPLGEIATASQFRHVSPFVPRVPAAKEYALGSFLPGRPIADAAFELMHRIHDEFRYDPAATSVATPLAEVFQRRHGVCQDFSHAMIACFRAMGLPARYVSGYLETRPPPGKQRLVGADASHAWVQFWCPGFGWIDLDPTNDVAVSERHVTVAVGRDFGDVTPLKGLLLGGGGQVVKVSVDVAPLVAKLAQQQQQQQQ
jgi:transglutaminase-like putative cysteine protease